ncbi:unnamed protein product, partial [Laminaria digitata]
GPQPRRYRPRDQGRAGRASWRRPHPHGQSSVKRKDIQKTTHKSYKIHTKKRDRQTTHKTPKIHANDKYKQNTHKRHTIDTKGIQKTHEIHPCTTFSLTVRLEGRHLNICSNRKYIPRSFSEILRIRFYTVGLLKGRHRNVYHTCVGNIFPQEDIPRRIREIPDTPYTASLS